MKSFVAILFVVSALSLAGQSPTKLPSSFLDDDTYFATVFAGGGISSDGTVKPASVQFGGSVGSAALARDSGGIGFLQLFETGAIGPLATRTAPAVFLSYDLGVNLLLSRNTHTVPFAVAGYSYLFSQAGAINYGIGIDRYYAPYRAIRFELRDYLTFTQTPQHNAAFRVAWVFSVHNP